MSQVYNKNSSAGKRPRSYGGWREDNWTCPACGNVNYSFRTRCNVNKCAELRPSGHSTVDSKNSSARKRPRSDCGRREDDWTCPACGNVNFWFRTRCNVNKCAQLRPSEHSTVANKNSSAGKRPRTDGVRRENDWTCPACGNVNYSFRIKCTVNKCAQPRPSEHNTVANKNSSAGKLAGTGGGRREDDWTCPACGNVNFSFRTKCNMNKCAQPRPSEHSTVDNTSSLAGKRARTDGGGREDDWTCPACGNVNFSFRTKCNLIKCSQPRPSEHSTKSLVKPLQAPPAYAYPGGHMGAAAPAIYPEPPQHGSSFFSGSAPYDRPLSGGSANHNDYGNHLPVGGPYGSLHLSGPLPYSSASMLGSGGIHGGPSIMDRHRVGSPLAHISLGPKVNGLSEEHLNTAGRENDWKCPKCGNNNFSSRTMCNKRTCNTPRPGNQDSKPENANCSKLIMPEGSWKCSNIKYPFRINYNRQNCCADKPELAKASYENE